MKTIIIICALIIACQAKPKVFIDTDPGIDDTAAILMLLSAHSRQLVDVVGISTVPGNTYTEYSNINVLRMLEVAKLLDISVYPGSEYQFVVDFDYIGQHWTGRDGYGDIQFNSTPSTALLQNLTAPAALAFFIQKYPGEISLLSIGPMTNVAIAISIDPNLTSKLASFYQMGGNVTLQSNVSSVSEVEFNFLVDPEAAKVVLERTQIPINLVSGDICRAKSFLTYEQRIAVGKCNTDTAEFLNLIGMPFVEKSGKWITFDELLSAWFLDEFNPETKLEQETYSFYGVVELQGDDRGALVEAENGNNPNIIALMDFDEELYLNYLEETFCTQFY